jgi:hypothetical protein
MLRRRKIRCHHALRLNFVADLTHHNVGLLVCFLWSAWSLSILIYVIVAFLCLSRDGITHFHSVIFM